MCANFGRRSPLSIGDYNTVQKLRNGHLIIAVSKHIEAKDGLHAYAHSVSETDMEH